jgi:CheY-like chemotaxis protein
VLVVDDSRSIREAASLVLAQAGYQVEVAADGKEAWERLQERAYSLLVTDLEMPHMSGLKLIGKLRRTPACASLPIVVLTSRAGQAARAREAGADALVGKPLRRDALLEAVRATIRRPA